MTRVIMTAYAIDKPEILSAVLLLQRDHLYPVRLVVDKAQTNRTPEQRRVIQQAKANGLNVFLGSGGPLRDHYEAAGRGRMSFNGVLHAKVLLVEREHQGQNGLEGPSIGPQLLGEI